MEKDRVNKVLAGQAVTVKDPLTVDDQWKHSFIGTIKSYNKAIYTIVDQEDNVFMVDKDKIDPIKLSFDEFMEAADIVKPFLTYYSEEIQDFKANNPNLCSYTIVTYDNTWCIVEGYHIVNRIGYIFARNDLGCMEVEIDSDNLETLSAYSENFSK